MVLRALLAVKKNMVSLLIPLALPAFGLNRESSFNLSSTYVQNPPSETYFENNTQILERAFYREIIKASYSRRLKVEFNAYCLVEGFSERGTLDEYLPSRDIHNRSLRLEKYWYQSDTIDGIIALDRLNIRAAIKRLQITLGRFPIDMSKTFVFRPNDLFAPFKAYQFDRDYKSGVDALQILYPIGYLGALRWISVAGYKEREKEDIFSTDREKENQFDSKKASSIVQYSDTFGGVYLSGLAGKYGSYNILGLGSEGEMFRSFGFHLDFRQLLGTGANKNNYIDGVIGLDYRLFESTLLQIEGFYHGQGYKNKERYEEIGDASAREDSSGFENIGRYYGAYMISQGLGPLMDLRFLAQNNMVDHSWLFTLFIKRSIADNVNATLIINNNKGAPPEGDLIVSEYGTYPKMLAFEIGLYF